MKMGASVVTMMVSVSKGFQCQGPGTLHPYSVWGSPYDDALAFVKCQGTSSGPLWSPSMLPVLSLCLALCGHSRVCGIQSAIMGI